jgi:hypothetical protein
MKYSIPEHRKVYVSTLAILKSNRNTNYWIGTSDSIFYGHYWVKEVSHVE